RRAIVDRDGVTPPPWRAADMTRILVDELAEHGDVRASGTPRADISHAPEHATLVFAVDPRGRTTIGRVEGVGRATVSRSELLGRLGLRAGAPYQRDELSARIERYVEERRAAGFYEARIVPNVALSDGDRVADVTLTITPGPRVRVVFAGDPLPA